jgi:hypothetical protein
MSALPEARLFAQPKPCLRRSLTGRSTRTPTQAMPSAFSWPVSVPSALRATAPVNLGVSHHTALTMKKLLVTLFASSIMSAYAGSIVTEVPANTNPSSTYVIYLHGRIIEDSGPRPIDSRFGLYDYPAVLDSLASTGAIVISAQRRTNTDVNEYAGVVVSQIERLIRSGVPAKHIVVVGFSKGGDIAIHVSSFLRRPEVRFVLQAACFNIPDEPQIRLSGRVLSIIEASDTLAGMSCKPYTDHTERPESFEEIRISTGRSHGAFYQPQEAWLKPTLKWIHGDG